jgi:hypothetical protein
MSCIYFRIFRINNKNDNSNFNEIKFKIINDIEIIQNFACQQVFYKHHF